MKRLRLIVAFLIVLLLLLSSTVFAQPFATGSGEVSRIWVCEINNTTGDYNDYFVPTTTIIAGTHRILGIAIVPNDTSKHSELIVGIHDIVVGQKGGTVNECIVEAEATENNMGFVWFPYPLSINTQVVSHQGANTTVYIYYA